MFDAQLRDLLVTKYQNRPISQRPEHYLIATDPDRVDQRAWLNEALELLPEPGRSKLWSRLEANKSFLETYHELATAAILQGAGLAPRYEEPLNGITPDFTVRDDEGHRTLIVEVANRMRPDTTDSGVRRWQLLQERVRRIPIPLGIVTRSVTMSGPAPDVAKRIEQKLKSWLVDPSCRQKSVLEVEGYQFALFGDLPGSHADLAFPLGGSWTSTDKDLLPLIHTKANKYGPLAEKLGIPLVVVLGADFWLPLDVNMLRSTMAGQLSISVKLDLLADVPSSGPLQLHQTDALPLWPPGLSAIAWLTPGTNEPRTITLFPTQHASISHGLPIAGRIHSG